MTKVSIIIPCLNEEKTIDTVLQAIHDQDFPKKVLEIVIADGGSVDNTLSIIEKFREIHPDLSITVIPNPQKKFRLL